MTEEQVILSRGLPKRKNISSGHLNDQWVYENTYVYFSNGKMSRFSDLKRF